MTKRWSKYNHRTNLSSTGFRNTFYTITKHDEILRAHHWSINLLTHRQVENIFIYSGFSKETKNCYLFINYWKKFVRRRFINKYCIFTIWLAWLRQKYASWVMKFTILVVLPWLCHFYKFSVPFMCQGVEQKIYFLNTHLTLFTPILSDIGVVGHGKWNFLFPYPTIQMLHNQIW